MVSYWSIGNTRGEGTIPREAELRKLILGIAVLCCAAALAVAGAGLRIPIAQPTWAEQLVPANAPVTVADLAREQAADRELVTELRATVTQLQQEIERQSAALLDSEPQGRTVTVFCCDLLPPGRETPAPGARELVRSVLPEIMADARQIVSVEGHSDSRPILSGAGKRFKNNTDLSLLRAKAVAALLHQQGVPGGRIRVKGWGDTRPLVTNDTAEGRDRNRRVEIRLLPPTPGL